MKSAKIISLILILVLSTAPSASAADVFSVKTALNTSASKQICGISVPPGEILEFSANDLEMRLGLKPQSMSGITVTALPKPEQGNLVLDGVGVSLFDFLAREDVNRLCFVPSEEAVATSVTFIPKAEKAPTTELAISVLASPNLAPELQSLNVETVSNIAISGFLEAADPEDDATGVKLMTEPANGTVRFDGMSFVYTPYKDVYGKDSFTVCAVDSMNNFSNEATVSVTIERPKQAFSYADMQIHPSAFAAIKLREHGVMTGLQIGGKSFFMPDETTTRGEFFVMLMSASGLEASMKPTVNTGLPNDAEIPSWLKPYVKKAIDEDIWSATQPFYYSQTPTRAEAVVLTARTSKIKDVRDASLTMSDVVELPDWAVGSYKTLAAYKMLDLYDGAARPAHALTNSYSADLIWQLYKHCHR